MLTGTTLIIQKMDGIEPLGAFNQPVYQNYSQLIEALRRKLGDDEADYFARPEIDGNTGRIAWTATQRGTVRRWIDMTPAEQAEVEPVRLRYNEAIQGYQAELERAPENSERRRYAQVLRQALETPGPEYLYFVNGKPVVTFWGFKRVNAQTGINPLLFHYTTQKMGGAAPFIEPETVIPPPPPPPAAVLVATVPWWRRWWWWLLLLLLLLLLLFGLYRLFWMPQLPLGLPPLGGALPQVELPSLKPDGGIVPPRSGGPDGVAAPGIGGSGGGSSVVPNGGPNGDMPPHAAPDGKAPTLPQQSDDHPVPVPDKVPANLPPLPKVGTPPGGKPLDIPPDAPPGPAKYMHGVWWSMAGLRDPEGRRLEQLYTFDQDGKGQVVVRGKDGRRCSGSAEAVTSPQGALVIRETQSLQCNDQHPLSGAVTTCRRSPQGEVACEGVNQADGSKFQVQMDHVDETPK